MDKGLIYALAFSGGDVSDGDSATKLEKKNITIDSEYINMGDSSCVLYTTGLGLLSVELSVSLKKNVPAGTSISIPFTGFTEWAEKYKNTFDFVAGLFGCAGVGIAEDAKMFIVRVFGSSISLYFPVAVNSTRTSASGAVTNRLYSWFTV